MKNFIRIASLIGLFPLSQLAYSADITDTYATGDTLTATTLNNIKSAVNDNDARATTLENSQTVQDGDIGNLEVGQQALQAKDATQDTRLDTLEAADLINRITAMEASLTAHIVDLANPHAVTKTQVGLANLEDIRVNYTATTTPTVNDDINSGYSVGSVWIDTTQELVYVLVDSAPGVAVWKTVTNTNKTYVPGDTGPAGGVVFYVTADRLHGLEAAPVDQGSATWGCAGTEIQGASGVGIGWGVQNTSDIMNGCPGIQAANLADTYILNRYYDWYLPSADELELLYNRKDVVGGFTSLDYWSSTENGSGFAWYRSFVPGNRATDPKGVVYAVRAIRAF